MLLKVSRIRIALLVLPFILIFYVLRQKPSNASIPIKHEQFNPPSSRVISPIIQPESKPALQSESKPALQPVELKQNLRYAYINGHAGTSADFTYLAEHVGFTFSEFDVRNIHIWGQSQDKANDLNFHKLAEFFCTGFDVIAVGDVNTDARFLLQYIDQDPEDGSPRRDGKQRCAVKRIIMQTTNRFDFGVGGDDQQEWFNLVKRVVKRKDSVITWVYNNPWEKRYMEVRLGKNNLPTKMFLIRPFGFSKLPPAKKVSKEEADKPVIFDHPFIGKYHKVLTEAGIDVKLLGWQYGGPTALAQYRCVIDLPYQTSTMKWYENLAAGVVSLVPTPRFLREIVEKHKDLNFVNILPTFDIGEDWFKYIEFYGDDLGEYFYKFDSLDDLKRILAQDVIDVDNVRDRAPVMWEKVRMEAIETWKDILFL